MRVSRDTLDIPNIINENDGKLKVKKVMSGNWARNRADGLLNRAEARNLFFNTDANWLRSSVCISLTISHGDG